MHNVKQIWIIFCVTYTFQNYRHTANMRRTWVGTKIFDHSDVVAASPVGATPITSSFST